MKKCSSCGNRYKPFGKTTHCATCYALWKAIYYAIEDVGAVPTPEMLQQIFDTKRGEIRRKRSESRRVKLGVDNQ